MLLASNKQKHKEITKNRKTKHTEKDRREEQRPVGTPKKYIIIICLKFGQTIIQNNTMYENNSSTEGLTRSFTAQTKLHNLAMCWQLSLPEHYLHLGSVSK
jgi:exosome complex RNA-binding protein Rrp42 (RNase PH superfamily)